MKKVFSKELWKKFLVAFMIIISCFWVAPEEVRAEDEAGGKLAEPVADLLIALGDGAVKIAHRFVLKSEGDTLITIDTSVDALHWLAAIVAGALAAVVAVGLVLLAATGIGLLIEAIVGITLASLSIGTVLAVAVTTRRSSRCCVL